MNTKARRICLHIFLLGLAIAAPIATGFASWTILANDSLNNGGGIDVDQDVVNLKAAISVSEPSFPELGEYFYFYPSDTTHYETATLTYDLNIDPTKLSSPCIVNGKVNLYVTFVLSLGDSESVFADSSCLTSAQYSGETVHGAYNGSSYSFDAQLSTAGMDQEVKRLSFMFSNKLVYAFKDEALSKSFMLEIEFLRFAS